MARLAIWLLVLLAAPAIARPSWDFVATFPAKQGDPVEVQATLSGETGPVRLCTPRDGAGQYFHDLKAGEQFVAPDADDPDCWSLRAPRGGLRLSYRVELATEADDSHDPDRAASIHGTFVFEEDAILLSPAPRPTGEYTIEFRLPAGVEVEAPWERLSPTRFRTSWEQYEMSSYVAVGTLRRLGEVPVRGGAFALTAIGPAGRVKDETLRSWVRRAGASVANFYQGLPAPRVEALLVGEDCSDHGGIFGTTLRNGRPSVVLFYCADAPDDAFADDWVATHEFVHLGNPRLGHRVPWFTEGSATYYQDVLRARSGERSPAQMWGDLYDGFHRFCAPVDGLSLRDESDGLRRRHRYQRVYWGAACLFFRVDVAIRLRTHGEQSLDTVMRTLLKKSRAEPLEERDLLDALDAAAGEPIANESLVAKEPFALAPLFHELGIEPVGEELVKLHDDAPLARVRQQMFQADP
jgi:hypothetical protein